MLKESLHIPKIHSNGLILVSDKKLEKPNIMLPEDKIKSS
jgi:hypothetical protein